MPIKSAFWSSDRGLDLHVLSGQSTPNLFASHLAFTKMDGKGEFAKSYLDDPSNLSDVTVEFTPLIKGTLTGDLFKGGGVEVNKKTGVVKVANPLPDPHLRNFILQAEVTNSADGKKYTLLIRIHIHKSVTNFWLTPDTLTIRPNGTPRPDETKYKFTARALFDDGTLGDVTENHGITWTPTNFFNARREIVLRVGDDPGDPAITVTAKLPASWGGASDTAEVKVAQPWGDATTASLIVGGGWPGAINPATVPNFLFLCDGFTNTPKDRDSFEQLSNSIVRRFKTNHLTTPFDKLTDSINFWRVFIPSDVRGISVLCEVCTVLQEGELRAYMVNNAVRPPAAGAWNLNHVVFAAGLPVLADHSSNLARTNADIRTDWGKLYDPDPSPNVPDPLLNAWRLLANRTFVEEKDTPLCMSYGLPPQVDQESDNRNINFHPRRLKRQRDKDKEDQSRFDRFLGSLTGEDLTDLTSMWAEKARVRPSNYDLIFILTNCRWDRGKNFDAGYITMNVSDLPYFTGVAFVAGKNALAWNPPDPPTNISAVRSGRALHEIAHSFGLGDEYSTSDEPFTGSADALKVYGNLQFESDAQSAGDIHGDEIKWNWRRARKGAVVHGDVLSAGVDRWTVKVKLGQGAQFAKDDPVILRKRTPLLPLSKRPVESALLKVAEKPIGDEVIVTGVIDPALKFVEGDVLYRPTDAPASVKTPAYPFAEMVGHNIKTLITTDKRPLTATPCVAATSRLDVQVPNLGAVVTPLAAVHRPRIVGLYYGGHTKSCGIFHPAGTCMMNGTALDTLEFCFVCRYILVEMLNPYKHFEIDILYDSFYPQS